MRAFAQALLPPLIRVCEIAAAALLFIMMMLTFADVVGRYIFAAPIFGAAEMIQFLLAMTIFAGLCLVNARDDHITVELFEPQLDRLFPTSRRIIVQIFSVGMMAVIAYQLFQFALHAEKIGRKTVVLEWSFASVAFTVAGLSVVSLIAQILGLMLPRPVHHPDDPGAAL
ncbi:MAG: TRAP transporter small permease subunit [Rhodopseudomonas sp.]|nr:TRAP transporter small permease subunit [Rhodopseudomonas sp.]